MDNFILPAGTVCKRNGIPFMLMTTTLIECHPDSWPLIRDDFKPEVGYPRFDFNQSEQLPVNPFQAAALPVTSITSNSSGPSSFRVELDLKNTM